MPSKDDFLALVLLTLDAGQNIYEEFGLQKDPLAETTVFGEPERRAGFVHKLQCAVEIFISTERQLL